MRKLVFEVSDQVPHKLGFTTTEDGERLEISNIGCRADLFTLKVAHV